MKKFIIILILIIVIIAILFTIKSIKPIKETFDPANFTISLIGDEKITLNLYDDYNDQGAIAKYGNTDISNLITYDSQISTKKLGTFKQTYTINYNNVTKSVSREIEITVPKEDIAKDLPVLMYHFFYNKNNGESGTDSNFMDISDFENQIKYLSENNYYLPDWNEVVSFVNGSLNLPDKSVVLTVDDGSDTFFNLAVPILEKYKIPATSFVITSWFGDTSLLNQYKEKGIYIESHSHDMHRAGTDGKGRILTLSHDLALADLKSSQEICGSSLVFCYPFGHFNDQAKQLLKEAGFKLAFTTAYGKVKPGMDCLELPRIRMSKGDSLNSFKNKIK